MKEAWRLVDFCDALRKLDRAPMGGWGNEARTIPGSERLMVPFGDADGVAMGGAWG